VESTQAEFVVHAHWRILSIVAITIIICTNETTTYFNSSRVLFRCSAFPRASAPVEVTPHCQRLQWEAWVWTSSLGPQQSSELLVVNTQHAIKLYTPANSPPTTVITVVEGMLWNTGYW